jgi:serine/threonine protein phosphatase 1
MAVSEGIQRIFAIGDIHGCYDPLVKLLERIPIDWPRDRLVFMGDYIDRGLQSFEVVEYLIELQERHPGTVFLKGNHEQMLEDYLSGKDRMTYLYNGGQQIPPAHLRFFGSLRLMFETEDYIFVHAGLRQNVVPEKQSPEDLLWIRDSFINSRHSFGKRVVFGHTPFEEPRVEPNKIGIDTGAVFGNKLTCVQLPEEEFYFA